MLMQATLKLPACTGPYKEGVRVKSSHGVTITAEIYFLYAHK